MPTNSICGGPITNLHSVLCILIEILLRVHAKGRGGIGVNGDNDDELMLNVLRCQLTY